MDAFLYDWELECGVDERLWVVTPAGKPSEVAAYYAVEPDPLELAVGTVKLYDGIVHLTGLATAKKHEGRGLATRLLLRVFTQIADLDPCPVLVLVGEALDDEALGFYLSRDLGSSVLPVHLPGVSASESKPFAI